MWKYRKKILKQRRYQSHHLEEPKECILLNFSKTKPLKIYKKCFSFQLKHIFWLLKN